ncbi:MAG: hypothetical protein HYY30_14875 [Chloroflexi bacterium]|nr:hypothetical protein [Chloroflexota bacterium]
MVKRVEFKISEPSGPLVGLTSLLIIGLIVGLLLGWAWSSLDQEGIREDDYLVMVSLLYARDRSMPNALERLAVLEDDNVAQDIASLAEAFPKEHPEAQAEARALQQLANGLAKPSAETAGQSVASAPGSSDGLGGAWLWLGIALVFVCFLGLGGPFALRFMHSTGPRFRTPWSRPSRRGTISLDRHSPRRPTVSLSQPRTVSRMRQRTVEEPPAPSEESDASIDILPLKPSSGLQFQSRYDFGEDTFDEVHPVMNTASGELIGACGLSAELKLSESSPERFFGFSVWAHDHAGGGSLKTIGIVSKWAKAKAPPTLVRWAETGKVDDIVVANPGMRLPIDTGALAIDVNITGFRYGADHDVPPESYFTNLAVTFDVKMKNLAEF